MTDAHDSYTPGPPRLEPVTLDGLVVRLEPLAPLHADDLRAVAFDPRIWEFMPVRVATVADFERWFDSALHFGENGLGLAFAVVLKANGRAVGSTRFLDYRPADRGVEIGHTWYAPDHWATEVNPEAKLLLMTHAFETLGLVRVQLKTDALNRRSRAAIARLGAKEEGILRKQVLVPGPRYRSSVYFSVLDEEWPAVKRGLVNRLENSVSI